MYTAGKDGNRMSDDERKDLYESDNNDEIEETVPTPEEEAEKAIQEAKAAEEEHSAQEEARRAWERVEALKRAEEERQREQERMAEEIRRENAAREEEARALKKTRRKKGLRLTAAVLAIALLVSAAGYAAGTITKTIQGFKN